MMKEISVIIDGKKIKVPEGTTVLLSLIHI
mgnify:CR=1 FL=1